jgi:hypothetical protein
LNALPDFKTARSAELEGVMAMSDQIKSPAAVMATPHQETPAECREPALERREWNKDSTNHTIRLDYPLVDEQPVTTVWSRQAET